MFKILGLPLVLFAVAGCVKNFDPLPKIKPAPSEKPSSPLSEPEWVWTYQSTDESSDLSAELKACPDEFAEAQTCNHLNYRCYFGQNIYRCQPKDSLLSFKGQVVDEQGAPVPGAYVHGGAGIEGYDELTKGYSDENGQFLLTLPHICIDLIYAQKDGYQSPQGHFLSGRSVNCRFDQWGDRELLIILKKMPRSARMPSVDIPADHCHIQGRVVTDKGLPLPETLITSGRQTTFTDGEGYYEFTYPGKCSRICSGRKEGYTHPNPRLRGQSHVSCMDGQPGDLVFTER